MIGKIQEVNSEGIAKYFITLESDVEYLPTKGIKTGSTAILNKNVERTWIFLENKGWQELTSSVVEKIVNLLESKEFDNLVTTSKNIVGAINEIDSSLEDTATYFIEDNIEGTLLIKGKKVDLEQLRFYQGINLAKFFQRLKLNQDVKIICLGDSLTYGQQTNGTREPDTTPCPDGSTHTAKRANTTYPEATKEYLSETFQGTITIENRGYSGDWTERSFQRWNKKHNGDLTIIDLGMNDALGSHVPLEQQTLEQYIYWYEQIIIRELLWGSAVVLIKPSRNRTDGNVKLDTYRKACDLLAQKYNLLILDGNEFTNNIQYFIYSDTTHLDERGYRIKGARVTTALCSMCDKESVKVESNSIVLPRIERIILNGSTIVGDANAPTPWENFSTGGITAKVPLSKSIYIPVYTSTDNLYVNLIGKQTGTCKMQLDYGVQGADLSLKDGRWDNEPTEITIADLDINEYSTGLLIPTKGWHMIKVTCLTGELTFYALKFFAKFTDKIGAYFAKTHDSYSATPSEVSATEINVLDILNKIGLPNNGGEYWKNPSLKITITNYGQSIVSYIIPIGSLSGNGSGWLSFKPNEVARQNIISSPTNERKLKWVSFNKSTNNLKLDWEGDLTKLTSITFTVA